MKVSSKRARNVALTALLLSVVFFIASWVIGVGGGIFAIKALSWQILAGLFIWLVLVVLFHQRTLAEQEKLDIAQIAKAKQGDTIFRTDSDNAELFAVAQKRLAILEKWFLPAFAILIAVYEIAIGFSLVKKIAQPIEGINIDKLLAAVFMFIISFVSFLISRYSTGMSAEKAWRDLRAGGSSFLAASLLSFLLGVSCALGHFKIEVGLVILAWVIPVLLIVLGVETALNVILDIYRPRITGQYVRLAVDSRLLGLINEPGGFFHTIASTIDYQFGFKVSQTWFYKLLEKAIVPLVLFMMLMLYVFSCIVVIEPGHEAVIEHLGSFDRIAGPGINFKYPWPFDKTYKFATSRVQQIDIGFIQSDDDIGKPLLWGEKHYQEEYPILVATETVPGDGLKAIEDTVPVSIVQAAVPVQYKIRNLEDYLYNHVKPRMMLEEICYREFIRFAASAKIETDDQENSDGRLSILGAGRKAAGEFLTRQIQAKADEAQLGVEIVFVGLQGIHPPVEVAADYQNVIAAVQKKQKSILDAEAQANKILTELAGSIEQADQLYDLALKYLQARDSDDKQNIEILADQIKEAFSKAKGRLAKILMEAQSYSFERATLAKATGLRFQSQVQAYHAAPEIYTLLQRLVVLEEVLPGVRKYVFVSDQKDIQKYIIDLQEKLEVDLLDNLGIPETGGK